MGEVFKTICLGIIKGVKSDVRNITKLEVSKPAKRNPVLSVKPLSLSVALGMDHNSTLFPARLLAATILPTHLVWALRRSQG